MDSEEQDRFEKAVGMKERGEPIDKSPRSRFLMLGREIHKTAEKFPEEENYLSKSVRSLYTNS